MTAAHSYSQGISLYRQGRYDEAAGALSTVVDEPGLLGQLARYYQAQACRQAGLEMARAGQLQGAQEYLRRTMKLMGPNADLAGYLARIYMQMGMHDRAEAQLEAVAETHRDRPAAQAALAMAQHHNGRTTQAMLTLGAALRDHPDSAELHEAMGLALSREDRHKEAARHFAKAIECDCLRADAHYHLGLCEAAQGRCAEAARRLERAHSLRPNDVLLAYQLAIIARAAAEQGTPVQLTLREPTTTPAESDLRHLADFVASENDFVMAFLSLPVSPADEELFGLISAVLDTALELHPTYADLHYRQSLVCLRLGNAAGAVEHAQQAVTINPHYVQARIHLARLLAEAEPALAADHLHMAIESGGEYADAHALLGEVYCRLGNPVQAQVELHHALEINPRYKLAGEAMRRLVA